METGLEFLKQPEDVIVVRNSAVLLNCTATGDAASVNITWLKDGLLVNDARRSVLSNGSLYIKRVIAKKQPRRSDEGTYECIARNDIGAIISRKARLQIAGEYLLFLMFYVTELYFVCLFIFIKYQLKKLQPSKNDVLFLGNVVLQTVNVLDLSHSLFIFSKESFVRLLCQNLKLRTKCVGISAWNYNVQNAWWLRDAVWYLQFWFYFKFFAFPRAPEIPTALTAISVARCVKCQRITWCFLSPAMSQLNVMQGEFNAP